MTAYSPDTFCTKVTVVTGTNDTFVITESVGVGNNVVTVTLDAQDYWLHADNSYNSTMKGLYWAIAKVLNDGTTSTLGTRTGTPTNTSYAFEVATPTSSTGLTNNGLALRATGATVDFQIDWDDAAFKLDARLFGAATDSQVTPKASATDGGDEVATGAAATKHRLVTRTLGDGEATTKVREPYIDIEYSSGRPSDSVAIEWDSGFLRLFQYEDIPGVEVHEARAGENEWAAQTTRLAGDKNAVWFDIFMALNRGEQVLVIHNSSSDLQVDTHSYEVLKLDQPMPWSQFAVETSRGGNYYRVAFAAWVDETRSNYDH